MYEHSAEYNAGFQARTPYDNAGNNLPQGIFQHFSYIALTYA